MDHAIKRSSLPASAGRRSTLCAVSTHFPAARLKIKLPSCRDAGNVALSCRSIFQRVRTYAADTEPQSGADPLAPEAPAAFGRSCRGRPGAWPSLSGRGRPERHLCKLLSSAETADAVGSSICGSRSLGSVNHSLTFNGAWQMHAWALASFRNCTRMWYKNSERTGIQLYPVQRLGTVQVEVRPVVALQQLRLVQRVVNHLGWHPPFHCRSPLHATSAIIRLSECTVLKGNWLTFCCVILQFQTVGHHGARHIEPALALEASGVENST